MPSLPKSDFLLDPSVTFLNHGSFGACPREVFAAYQQWQLELERQPVLFLGRRIEDLLREAMKPLAQYVNADVEDMAFVPNATAGVNLIARSLTLTPDDEILTTEHEYGACRYAWEEVCKHTGSAYKQQKHSLPLSTPETFIDELWQGVTSRTRVIYLSHISSPTALVFPVEQVVQRARAEGLITVIDGAHAPAHIPLDLTALDADFYTGNCHKWMCAPKGSAFLYARKTYQAAIQPAFVSWGYHDARFAQRVEMQGTRDPAASLTVPAALHYIETHNWAAMQAASRALIESVWHELHAITGQQPIAQPGWFAQMVAVPLPPSTDTSVLKARLYDDYQIEIPVHRWLDMPLIRVAIQGYNTAEDVESLYTALGELLESN
ncbi:MAG: aminotransferase class V-fold PLP-dependent enzyme [Anaerolineae bacterium]|nr:aminotransferase class V-fold PLP-dependent enzyme [Anaerolineae bacterium]